MKSLSPRHFSILLATLLASALAVAAPGCGMLLGVEDGHLEQQDGGVDAALDAFTGAADSYTDARDSSSEASDASSPDANADTSVDAPASPFTLGIAAKQVNLVQGSMASFGVTLGRNGGSGPALVTVSNLPNGVTSAGLTIPDAATTGVVTLTAANGAVTGPVTISVSAEGGPGSTTTLLVQGPPGSIDTTFGAAGTARIKFSDSLSDLSDLLVTPGGDIVLMGNVVEPIPGQTYPDVGVALAKLDANGNLVQVFGSSGLAVANGPGHSADIPLHIMLSMTSGRLFVGGAMCGGSLTCRSWMAAAFTDAGVADTNYASGGFFAHDFGSDSWGIASALMSGDSLLLAGGAGPKGALLRLTPLGAVDDSFGDGGVLVVPDDHQGWVTSVGLQSNGSIVAVTSGASLLSVGRFSMDAGSLDTTYGTQGWATAPNITTGWPGLVVQADDKVAVVGATLGAPLDAGAPPVSEVCGNPYPTTEVGIFLTRLNADGSTDTNFGSGGTLNVTLPTGTAVAPRGVTHPALAADGHLAAVMTIPIPTGSTHFAAMRFTPDGKVDPTFGGTGTVGTAVGPDACAEAVGFDAYGRVIVAGKATDPGDVNFTDAIVVRFWP